MKAFTLIEMMAVIIVLGIILLITVPKISDSIKRSEESLYKEQVSQIEKISRNWGVSNSNLFSENEPYYLSLDTLKSEGLLEEKDLISPIDDSVMNGCVVIEFNENYNQYTYNYNENCPSDKNLN
ncbi:MAG: prepilin-type N-terminal cleavage/methylation domain-containing protein [Clostridium sp.]|nr:prepilin-type N-terminal cleavage/methylation domain-containing protein [Clostridium sp.]MCM1444342.1 prepilin-type N-terminal cleavage/methylation domain-containing protein [Candidatus Amulumruptor caecigallinarius]